MHGGTGGCCCDEETEKNNIMPAARRAAAPLYINIMFWICGLSIYARAEVFFLQAQLFQDCFRMGKYYFPVTAGCLCFPGLVIQIAQSKLDEGFDIRHGPKKAHMFRQSVSVCCSVALLVLYFAAVRVNSSIRSSITLLSLLLVFEGFSSSIQWGSFCQLLAVFPNSCQTFFFVGSMCPSILLAPMNAYVGELCDPTTCSVSWPGIDVFFGLAGVITIAGEIAFLVLVYSDIGHVCLDEYSSTLSSKLLSEDSGSSATYLLNDRQATVVPSACKPLTTLLSEDSSSPATSLLDGPQATVVLSHCNSFTTPFWSIEATEDDGEIPSSGRFSSLLGGLAFPYSSMQTSDMGGNYIRVLCALFFVLCLVVLQFPVCFRVLLLSLMLM